VGLDIVEPPFLFEMPRQGRSGTFNISRLAAWQMSKNDPVDDLLHSTKTRVVAVRQTRRAHV